MTEWANNNMVVSAGHIERVNTVKLLGNNFDANFSWQSHVEAITSKATRRLYFLKQLRRAGIPQAMGTESESESLECGF